MTMSLMTAPLGFAVMGLFDVPGLLKEPKHPNEPRHSLGTNGLRDNSVEHFILIQVLPKDN
jgi:hypothetical protein